MDTKIDRQTAENDVISWLEKKKVFQETREKFKDHIDIIIEAIQNKALVLNPDFTFEHTLLFPLCDEQENPLTTSLTYKARINDKQVQPHMRGVKNDDVDNRLNALIAALTNTSKGIISSLDSADKRISTAIGVFFM